MSLYHKYRPKELEEMIGNKNTILALSSDLEKKDKPHAYLLTGPTGCGKTTIGRIIAQRLGCIGNDFTEIDSADFRGIETIRDIRRQSQFHPMEIGSTCRVFLLDECFASGTLIKTPKGDTPIESILPNDIIYSLYGEDLVVKHFQNVVPLERVVKVNLKNNVSIFCSKDHLFLTNNGWKKAFQLKEDSLLLSFTSSMEIKNRNRGGWETPLNIKSYFTRSEKNKNIEFSRVENIEIFKSGNNDQSFSSIIHNKERDQGFIIFHDLQIKNHPSYFANNIAVHNCHQTTKDAQHALLKALENTPSHVYYILATTEPQDLLDTIKGRCSQYPVELLTEEEMTRLLRRVIKREKEEIDNELIEQITIDSMGHPRNALQILDQTLSVPAEKRLEIAKRMAETQSKTIELCRALFNFAGWKKISNILTGLKTEQPEQVRRAVYNYCGAILIKQDNMTAAKIMEQLEKPVYSNGWSQLVFEIYCAVKFSSK